MLFEELVEQHRVHRVVAHRVRFSALIWQHQRGIDLRDLFSDQTKLRCFPCIGLVMESDRSERKDRFTGRSHVGDVFFKALPRNTRAELAAVGYHDWRGVATLGSDAI